MTISNIASYTPLVGECRNDINCPLNINNQYIKTLLFIVNHQICYISLRNLVVPSLL